MTSFYNRLMLLKLTAREHTMGCVRASDLVLQRLKQKKINGATLGRALGVSRQSGSLMLRGKQNIPIWHLDAIAHLLGTSVPDLFSSSATSPVMAGSQNASSNVLSEQQPGRGIDAAHTASTRLKHDAGTVAPPADLELNILRSTLKSIGALVRDAEQATGTGTRAGGHAHKEHRVSARKRGAAR